MFLPSARLIIESAAVSVPAAMGEPSVALIRNRTFGCSETSDNFLLTISIFSTIDFDNSFASNSAPSVLPIVSMRLSKDGISNPSSVITKGIPVRLICSTTSGGPDSDEAIIKSGESDKRPSAPSCLTYPISGRDVTDGG